MRPFSGKKYFENSNRCLDDELPCVVCGRPIKDGREAGWLEVVDGGRLFSKNDEEADKDDPGYMGCWPIGSSCLRKFKSELSPYLMKK